MSKAKTTADKSVTLERTDTKKIILPENMSTKDAREWLARWEAEDERVVTVNDSTDIFLPDGLQALAKALADIYGWVNLVPTPGFFGPTPPQMLSLRTGPGDTDTIQVPWGNIAIPGIEGYLTTSFYFKNNLPYFQLGGTVKRKNEKEVKTIVARTREIARTQSLYRHRALKVNFVEDLEDAQSMEEFFPTFLDLGALKDPLVFPAEVDRLVKANIFTPIEHTEACRTHGIPLKRGVLLAGAYGVGKTLTAYHTAKTATENGWTFLYLQSVSQLSEAITWAKQYQPCVLFAEDVDQILAGDGRNEDVNAVLNTIDGVDSKGSELMVVLTTNHVDNVNPAFLRPGRLDAVIHIGLPDAEAAHRLLLQYGRGLIDETSDLTKASAMLAGKIPAVIREVVERSKLAMVMRVTAYGGEDKVTGDDLCVSCESMHKHLELLSPKPKDTRSPFEKASQILVDGISQTLKDVVVTETTFTEAEPYFVPPTENKENRGKRLPKG